MSRKSLTIESESMKENALLYLLSTLRSKIDWVPFATASKNKLYQDINFDRIEIKSNSILDTAVGSI